MPITRLWKVRLNVAASLLLLVTILNALAVDHTLLPFADQLSVEHAQHCHLGPSGCGDQPVPSGPGQFLFTQALTPAPELPSFSVAQASEPAPTALSLKPPVPPPRA